MVVTAHLTEPDRAALRSALPAARVTVVRLRADPETLREHVRARCSYARLAGDDLLGADPEDQAAVLGAAIAEQDTLDASARDDAVLDVSRRTPADVIAEVAALLAP